MKQFATITVIGRDKTGVIARVTNFLFEQKANIEALEEQVTRGQFSMTLQASWKESQLDRPAVCGGLGKLAAELEMEIKIRFTEPHRRQRDVTGRKMLDQCRAGLGDEFGMNGRSHHRQSLEDRHRLRRGQRNLPVRTRDKSAPQRQRTADEVPRP